MPDWQEEIRRRLALLELDPAREAVIIEELAAHAADRYEELLRQGAREEDAYRRTLEELSDSKFPANLVPAPKALFSRRFPFAARILVKYWKLSAVAVVSLSIAIAAAVLGLSFFNALLLRPPTAAAANKLLTIYESSPSQAVQQISFPEYRFYRDNSRVFSGVAAFNYGIGLTDFSYGNSRQRAVVSTVSENYFQVLGVRPASGRFLAGDDSTPKAEVVISYGFWKRLGSPDIAGKTMLSGNQAITVAGVAQKDFSGTVAGFAIDVWAPIRISQLIHPQSAANLEDRGNRWLTLVGRLRPGATRDQAQEELSILAQHQAHDFPNSNKDYTAKVSPLTMLPVGQMDLARLFSWAVLGIVLLVLVAACANVVNLLLGLATTRRQEMLIRAALGATRSRLLRQLLYESALLCAFSSLIGSFLAWAGLERLFAFRPVIFNGLPPLLLDFRPDLRVLVLTVAVMLAATLTVGLVPALHASIPNLAAALNGEIAVGGTRKRRAQNVLVVIQTAICTLVLVGAGLCLRSIESLKRVPLGFSARNLVFTYVAGDDDPTEAQMKEFYERVRQAVAALPGVTSVSLATSLPLFQNGPPDLVAPEGQEASKEQWSPVSYNMVEDNYFSTLGLPVLSGRTFDPGDTTRSPEVVVINRTLAHKYWPEQDPLGKRLRIRNGNRLVQIVGVAGDSKYDDLGEPETPFMYFAIRQHPHDATDLALIARTSGQPRLWIEPVRDAIHKVNPSAFSFLETTMEDQINLSLLIPKIIFACVSGFGMLALVLSMAGLYATTSYSVRERRKEIGIRLALGAQPRRVMATLLRQATQIAAIGLILGIGMGVALSSGVSSLLYGVRTVDPVILIAVPAMTAALAVVTTYLAARQSLNVDPLEAVRHM